MDAAGRRMQRRIRMLQSLTVDRDRTGALYCCNECYTVGTMEHLGFDLETQRCIHCSTSTAILALHKAGKTVSKEINQREMMPLPVPKAP